MGCFSRRLFIATAVVLSACAYYDDSLLAPIDGGGEAGDGGTGGSQAAGASGTFGGASAGMGGGGAGIGGAPAGQSGAGGTPSAGSAGTAGSAGATSPVCVSKRPPGPPAAAGGGGNGTGGTGDLTFDLAFRDFDLGDGAVPKSNGYDLDGACTACTCQGDTSSRCLLPKLADGVASTDGGEGEDHAARALFLVASPFLATLSTSGIKKAVDAGDFTVLLRISGYNRQLDDPQVTVAWYVGTKLGKTPAWDGNDEWPIRDYTVKDKDPNKPISVDTNAYVRGGILVAGPKGADGTSRQVALQISSDFLINISGVFVTGKLVPTGATFSLEEGILAGKWSTDDVLKQLAGVRVVGQQVCPGTGPYETLAEKICSTADIALFDGSPTDPCTAVSVGVGYRATPAKVGVVVEQPPPGNDCATPYDPAKHGCGAL